MEIISSGFESVDDCEKFMIVNVMVSFCRDKQLEEVGTEMPIAA